MFAALTSILGKVGITGVESNLGTAIRTVVVLIMAWVIVFMKGKQSQLRHLDKRELIFLFFSGIATGASWLCYYYAIQNGVVSIVVPIYNAEQYLRRCVDSILNQEYTDFEVFLVNDGSTDSSGDICEEYGNKDTRVIVIQKENTGVSDSRNLALDRARGKYLQFLDSDDWITPDATRLFVRAAEEYGCDMVISDFYRVVGERLSPKGDIEEEGVLTQEEFAAHMMENPADFYYGVLWN